MLLMVPHSGIPRRLAVTLVQLFPPSWVSCTSPSLVPAQMSPGLSRDSAMANTTPAYSTPMLSGVKPPEICCRLLSFRVRSGLITCQLLPPSVVWWTYWLPVARRLGSLGLMVKGAVQTNRYLRSAAGPPPVLCGHTSTLPPGPVRGAERDTRPPRPPAPDR